LESLPITILCGSDILFSVISSNSLFDLHRKVNVIHFSIASWSLDSNWFPITQSIFVIRRKSLDTKLYQNVIQAQ